MGIRIGTLIPLNPTLVSYQCVSLGNPRSASLPSPFLSLSFSKTDCITEDAELCLVRRPSVCPSDKRASSSSYFSIKRSLRSEDLKRIFSFRVRLGIPSVGMLLQVSNNRRRTSSDGAVKYSSNASRSNGYHQPQTYVKDMSYLVDPDIWKRRAYSHSLDHRPSPHTLVLLHPDAIEDI
jgi:hypothetical protein